MSINKSAQNAKPLGPWHLPLRRVRCVNRACADAGRCGKGNVRVRNGKGGEQRRALLDVQHGVLGANGDAVVEHEDAAAAWAFVEKKQKHCDESKPEDALAGDPWDHTAIDVDSRFVVSLTVGKRTSENLIDVVADFVERTGGAPRPDYDGQLRRLRRRPDGPVWRDHRAASNGQARSTAGAAQEMARGVGVCDRREDVLEGQSDEAQSESGPRHAGGSRAGAEPIVVEHDDQHVVRRAPKRNGPNLQRPQGAKDVRVLEGPLRPRRGDLVGDVLNNFHHLNRGFRVLNADGSFLHRTPAMAIGLAQAPLSIADILTTQVIHSRTPVAPSLANFQRRPAARPAP